MKFKALFFSLFISIYSFSQSADITEGCIGMKVQFSAPSAGTWEFGDGTSSGQQNPVHIYTQPNTYQIKFNGVITPITIKVLPKPEIIITATPSKGCNPLNVAFKATLKNTLPNGVTVDNSSIEWNYQDGNNSTNTLTPNYTYTKSGEFNLGFYLNFKQNGNTACAKIDTTINNIIRVTDKPIIDFTPSATSACVPPLNVNFTNKTTSSSTITYKWDFGNGNSSTKQNGDPQTYSKTGNYSVKLIVADTNGCKDSLTKQINIGKPVADFYESTKKDTACVKNSINTNNTFFTNTSTSGNYTWTFDAGTTPSTSNQFNPGPVYFSTPGLHKVTLSVNANNCSDVKTINIMVQDPKIQIGINHSYSCRDTLTSFYNIKSVLNSGPVATYNWTFPNFPITKKGKPFPSNTNTATPKCYYNTFDSTYSVRQINIDTVSCQYLTTAGCYSNIATTVDTISEMWARIIPNIHEGCKDLTVTFSDSSTSHMKSPIDVWQWDFGDGTKQTNNSKTSPSHTYKSPGTYYATLIIKDNDYNCSDTSWKTEINVGDSLLPIDFTLSKNSICRGDSVQFTNTTDPVTASKIDAWNYSSNKENLSACFQNKDGNFIFNDTVGIHTITLTAEYNGCLIKKNHTLTVNGPIAHFDYIQDCRTPKIIKLINQAEGTGTVSWNIGGHIIPANPDTTVVDLSSFVPPISYGDVVIKQLIKGGTCGDDSTSSTIHYGVVKSNFNITDTTGKILNPVNGNILLGDASTGQKYLYDAQNSVDIYSQDCYRSYTFLQEGFRPRVWTLSKDTVIVSKQTKTGADNQIVQIIARNQNNCVDTSTIKIRIFDLNPQYVATIKNKVTNKDSIVTTVCLPTTLTFNGATSTADTTIQKYDWKFSDGSSGSGKIITHTFDSNTQKSDTISVTLTLTDVNGFSKTSQTIIPIYKPTATITAIPSIHLNDSTVYICDKDKVIFNATSQQTLSYQWTYENGYQTFTNNSTSPIFTVPNGQSSNIQKVLVNFVETATGCTGQTYRKINTQIYPTPSIISNVVNGIGCGNPSFNGKFSDNPSLNPPCNYTWNLGVNNIISTKINDYILFIT